MRSYGCALKVEDDKTGAGGTLVYGTNEAVLEDVLVVVTGDCGLVMDRGRDADAGTVRGARGTFGHAQEVCSIPQMDRRGRRSQSGVHPWVVDEMVDETGGIEGYGDSRWDESRRDEMR